MAVQNDREIVVRQGRITTSTPKLQTQAIYYKPSSAYIEDVPSPVAKPRVRFADSVEIVRGSGMLDSHTSTQNQVDPRGKPGNLVRRGAIRRKTTKDSSSSYSSRDRYSTDMPSSDRRFSYDGEPHRQQQSVRFANPAANIRRQRDAGAELNDKYVSKPHVQPRAAAFAVGPPPRSESGHRLSRFREEFDLPPTSFDEILGKDMSRLHIGKR